MKNQSLFWMFALAAAPFGVLAATNAVVMPVEATPAAPNPAWVAVIPMAVAMVVQVLRSLMPRLPKVLWPALAPTLGALGEVALEYAGWVNLPWWAGPILGSAAVGFRELADQARKMGAPAKVTAWVLTGLLAAGGFSASGCKATLEPGGPYAPVDAGGQPTVEPDMGLFAVDSAFQLAVKSLEFVCTYEKQNRAALWKLSPDIKRSLDKVRDESWEVARLFHKAREGYVAHRTPAGLTQLKAVLGRMQQLTTAAQAVLPEVVNKMGASRTGN